MTPGDDYWIMPWPSQHHGTVHGESKSLGPSPPLNPWKNRTLVKQKPISTASSSSQLWQKQKTCIKLTKTAAASIPKQSSQPIGPNKVLYRQVCFHNGRPRPTILVGSWSQRRNTCRSFLGMKPSKGGQWVAIFIYMYIYTYSLAMWQSHPIFLCFTSFGVQLVGRFGEGNLSRQKTLKPDWTSRFQKSSTSPKKTSLKSRLPYTTTSIPSPGICGCFFHRLGGSPWRSVVPHLDRFDIHFQPVFGGKHA